MTQLPLACGPWALDSRVPLPSLPDALPISVPLVPQSRFVKKVKFTVPVGVGPVPLTVTWSCTVVPAVVLTPTGALLWSGRTGIRLGSSQIVVRGAHSWSLEL